VIALDLEVADEMIFAKIKNWKILNDNDLAVTINKIGLEQRQYAEFIKSI